jgi:hypothetical protein
MHGAAFTIASYSPCELTETACHGPVFSPGR